MNIRKCEFCQKELDINNQYGTGRFCCSKCAHAFATLNDNIKELKQCKCIKCGKIIFINKRASTSKAKCNDCKEYSNCKILKIDVKKDDKKVFKKVKKSYICKLTGQTIEYCNDCKLKELNLCKSPFKMNTSLKPLSILQFNSLGTINAISEFLDYKKYFENLYNDLQLSSIDINTLFNGKRTEYLIHNIFNIERRHLSNAISLSLSKGKGKVEKYNNINDYKYKQEWHTTWNGKKVFLRSSYEIDYADELDKLKINYDVENLHLSYYDTQKQKIRCAIPDFYLTDSNTIVEIKSIFTLDVQNMKDKFKAYKDLGYNCKLILEHNEVDINTIQKIDQHHIKIVL